MTSCGFSNSRKDRASTLLTKAALAKTPMSPHRLTRRPDIRFGNVLVIFVFMVFFSMAMAALVLDVGYARLTQHQMQTAAETAALEGLRYRDDLPAAWRPNGTMTPNLPPALIAEIGPQPPLPYDPTNAAWQTWLDGARRYAASTTVSLMFDDDLNPADGDALQLGAGPVASVTQTLGSTDLEAGGVVTLPNGAPVYKPSLQANPTNVMAGDLVAGQYGQNPAYSPAIPLDEDQNYNRRDFIPDNPSGSVPESGFLARLRRSYENFDSEPGIASNGPNLPFLFGRGSMMVRSSQNRNDLTAGSGMTVRATAIAAAGSVTLPLPGAGTSSNQAGNVLGVGPVDPVNLIVGAAPFGLTATYWSSLVNPAKSAPGTDVATVNPTTGVITSTLVAPGGGTANPNTTEAGIVGANQTIVLTIGQVLAGAATDAPLSQSPTLYTYVPIYDTIGTTARTMVGFAYVQWTYTTGTLTLTVPWSTTLGTPTPRIASENATATLVAQFPTTITSSATPQALIEQIFTENQSLSGALMAPVVASRFIGPTTEP
jgi:hypothetical protein